jgi:hypothetical protein
VKVVLTLFVQLVLVRPEDAGYTTLYILESGTSGGLVEDDSDDQIRAEIVTKSSQWMRNLPPTQIVGNWQ